MLRQWLLNCFKLNQQKSSATTNNDINNNENYNDTFIIHF